jgi:NifB/MoaA-like Fe-S oxidoreductase
MLKRGVPPMNSLVSAETKITNSMQKKELSELQDLYNRVEQIERWIEENMKLDKHSEPYTHLSEGEGSFSKSFPRWNQVLAKISQNISKPSFDTWFAGTFAKFITDDTIIVYSKNDLHSKWLEARYKEAIFLAVKEVVGITYEIEFGVVGFNA